MSYSVWMMIELRTTPSLTVGLLPRYPAISSDTLDTNKSISRRVSRDEFSLRTSCKLRLRDRKPARNLQTLHRTRIHPGARGPRAAPNHHSAHYSTLRESAGANARP